MITDEDLETVITEMWAPAMELPVIRHAPVDDPAFAHAATIPISGSWNGHVCIDATDGFARRIAAQMFGIETAEVSVEDERDAIGELANVVGGNIKTLANENIENMGLPETGTPAERDLDGPPVADCWFSIGDGVVRITVREQD